MTIPCMPSAMVFSAMWGRAKGRDARTWSVWKSMPKTELVG